MEEESILTQPLVERRQQMRLTFTEPVQYRNVFKPNELYSGSLARDLSAGGVRIATPVPLAKDDRLVVLLTLPDAPTVIRAIARVAWQQQKPFGSIYESGLQFIQITPEDRDLVASFVERGVVS